MPEMDRRTILQAARGRLGMKIWLISAAALAVGTAAFIFGISNGLSQRAWQAFLINLVFWTGLACGAVMFSAVMVITKANWGRSLKRLAESPVFFLPAAFALFWLLFPGRDHLFPWIHEPVPEKAAWLNVGFFFAREGAVLFLLSAAALGMVFFGLRGDRRMLAHPEKVKTPSGSRGQTIFANIYGIFFGMLLSLLAFDLIMSLNPHWYSTLFGAYYFVGSFFTGLAALIILCFYAKRALGLAAFIKPQHLHNLGKLLLGFCLVTADFFFTQYFIMWYGNLPEESRFILHRVRGLPWEPMAYTVLTVAFVLPFFTLLSRRVKMNHGFMVVLCGVILTGMWLERFILIAPSVWKSDDLPLGLVEVLITLGFAGLMGLCVAFFLSRFPLLPVSDPLFWKGLERYE